MSKSFGTDIILEDVSLLVEKRQKYALVGRNGTGKTTLLKIICGLDEPDQGQIHLAKGANVGYLKQEDSVSGNLTVYQEAQTAQAASLQLKTRLAELEKALESGSSEELLEEYTLLHEHFLDAEGYSLDHDAKTVLLKMGFEEAEFSKPVSVLSGGERTRLALAKLLLQEPDLLILDEPTNHLDLQATEWLERWIKSYHGAVLLVSHDRRFLEATADGFYDLRDRTVKTYIGDFAQYQRVKAEDDARQESLAAKQSQELAKLDEFVRRFMNSQRTAQARGRLKMMEKLAAKKVDAPSHDRGMSAGFGKSVRSGDLVLSCSALRVGFRSETAGQVELFPPLDWTVRWAERWGVIGENGAGKSTLIKTILGEADPLGGMSKLGANVQVGYFHQDVSDLDGDMTPLEFLVYEAGMDTGPARDLLGRFLFSGDDVFRSVNKLSGGEKNKLVLAMLVQMNPNLLVLDEPTNHLDMDSRSALAEVLKGFGGTLILVSHDRWLLENTVDKTLDVRKSGAVTFPGGYTDYWVKSKQQGSPARQQRPVPNPAADQLQSARGSARELSKEIQKQEKLVAQIELEVADAEQALKMVEKNLAELPPTADIFDLTSKHQRLTEEIASGLAAWEENARLLENLKSKQGPADHLPGVSFR